jgi:hypothetical protein
MKMKFLAFLSATTLALTFACGDSETTNTTTSSGGGGSTSTSMGGGGSSGDMCVSDGPMTPRPDAGDCQSACEILFCCAAQECTALSSGDKDLFVPDCVQTCMAMMATIDLANGEDCETTVNSAKAGSTDFVNQCVNGIGN